MATQQTTIARTQHTHTAPWRFFALFVLCGLCLASSLAAQTNETESNAPGRSKSFDVNVGQLKPEDVPKATPKPEPSAKRTRPSLADAEALVRQLSQSLHSGCCPSKTMGDTTCPCHDWQARMLEFLAREGFSHQEIKGFMVNGGPPELRAAYRFWLIDVHGFREGEALERHFKLNFEGAPHPLGWDQGWSKLVLEGPTSTVPWALMGLAALACLIVFAFGILLVFRRKAEPAGQGHEPIDADQMSRLEDEARELKH